MGSIYFGEDDDLKRSISEVFLRLPEDVRDYLLEECHVISAGKILFGTVWPTEILANGPHNFKKWLIVFSENLPEDMEYKHSIIAHEMAYAYLKHDRLSETLTREVEKEAFILTGEWGFNGIGTSLEDCYYIYTH